MSADDVAAWSDPVPSLAELGAVHFVGIGGAGMSGIARILLARGVQVSGSDRRDTPTLLALRALGARVEVGHDPAHLDDADTVVVSTAIRADNPELVGRPRARPAGAAPGRGPGGGHGRTAQRRRRRHPRQDLDDVDADRGRAGAAGSTRPSPSAGTSTSRAATRTRARATSSSPRPTRATGPSCCWPRSARSSPTSRPTTSTTTATWPPSRPPSTGSSARWTRRASSSSAPTTRAPPASAACRAPAPAAHLRPGRGRRPPADRPRGRSRRHQLHGDPRRAATWAGSGSRCRASTWRCNSAAALLAGIELGLPAAELIEGLARFGGVHRRFELKGVVAGVRVYDDYAHHPTEVTAQLQRGPRRGRQRPAGGRLPAAPLQPDPGVRRRASARRSGLADEVVVMDVYGAREDPVPGVTGAMVADAVPLPPGRVLFEPSWSAAAPALAAARAAGRPGADDGRRRRVDGRAGGPGGTARRRTNRRAADAAEPDR